MTLGVWIAALLGLPVGFGLGMVTRQAFAWSRTTVTVLLLAALLPWFVYHGRMLNALRFGAVQSQWTYPSAFNWVHGVGYLVAACATLGAVVLSVRMPRALVLAPGLAFLGTLFVTLPLAAGAVSDGYFLISEAAVGAFWVGTMTATGVLLGYSWSSSDTA